MNPRRSVASIVLALIAGVLVGLTFNFFVALFWFLGCPGGRCAPFSSPLVWLATIGLLVLLYRAHPWAGYGVLGAYAALFLALLIAGGATGPYTCFGAYGYPSPR